MVLHIAIDGIDCTGKTTHTRHLLEFFKNKKYKVTVRSTPVHPPILKILTEYNLLNHEIALLTAFDRSLTYYGENWEEYDLVLWDTSILHDYAYLTDENTHQVYIKQLNRYFPLLDLYIIIKTDEYIREQDDQLHNNYSLIRKYEELETHKNTKTVKYHKNEPEKTFEEIVKTIFDNLPRCNWCGKLFTPNQKRYKYCTDECAKYSKEEQYRINTRNYYHRYKDVMSEKQKGGLGSKGANLHGTPDPNPLVEMEKLRKHRRAVGLKPFK